jgi:NhaP-type Na+/H+ or K+/H+ antiporter
MICSIVNASAAEFGHLNLALLFGLVVLGGTLGARIAQRLHVPQVVGCIVVGILFGHGLGLVTPERIQNLEPFTMFALGLIGFMIGAELRAEVFRKYGKQFFIILFSQGFGAFVLVAVAISIAAWLVTRNWYSSIAIGLVLGAIASATAPAATVNVLWEFKTRGPLTAAVLAIVALDDALALLLYRGAATGARALMGTGDGSVFTTVLVLFGEIVGAVLLGCLAGVILFFLLKFVRADDKILEFSISCLLLVVGLSMIPKIDPILPAMTFGITIACPRRCAHGVRKNNRLDGRHDYPVHHLPRRGQSLRRLVRRTLFSCPRCRSQVSRHLPSATGRRGHWPGHPRQPAVFSRPRPHHYHGRYDRHLPDGSLRPNAC